MDTLERDPTGRQPHEAGAKLDAGKSPVRRGLLEYFPRACLAVAEVSRHGAEKYLWGGWHSVPDAVERYGDAEARHICKAAIHGGPAALDPDSGLPHAAHEAWNALARLEKILEEQAARHDRELMTETFAPLEQLALGTKATPRRDLSPENTPRIAPIGVLWGCDDPGDSADMSDR